MKGTLNMHAAASSSSSISRGSREGIDSLGVADKLSAANYCGLPPCRVIDNIKEFPNLFEMNAEHGSGVWLLASPPVPRIQ
mmetsp:Transcript_21988/g.46256  ORF Transcript_21988/g.46256 Transcript_21988/m.46256 type:complete len:81 (-) Transcript_21988:412-654(-)